MKWSELLLRDARAARTRLALCDFGHAEFFSTRGGGAGPVARLPDVTARTLGGGAGAGAGGALAVRELPASAMNAEDAPALWSALRDIRDGLQTFSFHAPGHDGPNMRASFRGVRAVKQGMMHFFNWRSRRKNHTDPVPWLNGRRPPEVHGFVAWHGKHTGMFLALLLGGDGEAGTRRQRWRHADADDAAFANLTRAAEGPLQQHPPRGRRLLALRGAGGAGGGLAGRFSPLRYARDARFQPGELARAAASPRVRAAAAKLRGLFVDKRNPVYRAAAFDVLHKRYAPVAEDLTYDMKGFYLKNAQFMSTLSDDFIPPQ